MPTQGRSRIRQVLIGSVTGKVLHDSPIPVCTGVHLEHNPEFPEFRVRRLVCAIDFGRQSACVLLWGAALVRRFGAHMTVIHVSSDPSTAEASRDRLSAHVRSAGVSADVCVDHGEPHKVVTAHADRLCADLVVIGRGSANDMMGRLRAQTYGIVRLSPCPVLSV
jgi:nucleotide-binding universal stress UspA family protein